MSFAKDRWWDRCRAGGVLLLWAFAPGARAHELFLRFEKAPGGSKDPLHVKWTEASRFDSVMWVQGGMRDRKVVFGVVAGMPLGPEAPRLMHLAATGSMAGKVELEWMVPVPGGGQAVFYQAEFLDAFLRSVSTSGTADSAQQTVEFVYQTATFKVPLLKEGEPPTAASGVTIDPVAAVLLTGVWVKGERAVDGRVTLRWAAEAGRKYRVLAGETVDGSFGTVQEMTAAAAGELTVSFETGSAGQFYRVMQVD